MAKVTLVEWERGSPSPPSVNKSHPTQQHVFDSGKKIRWRKWGSPFIIPNNFFFLSPPRFGSEAPPKWHPQVKLIGRGSAGEQTFWRWPGWISHTVEHCLARESKGCSDVVQL
jgi:hypothetical protein